MAQPAPAQTAAVLAFPRADLHGLLGGALKRHRLPETLANALVREASKFPDVSADAALAFALDQRMTPAPIDFEKARGILLVGPAGAGKSAVAAKIVREKDVERNPVYVMPAIDSTNVADAMKNVVTERAAFLKLLPTLVDENLAAGNIAYEGLPGQTR